MATGEREAVANVVRTWVPSLANLLPSLPPLWVIILKMSVGSSWCEKEEGLQRPSTTPSLPPAALILGLVSFLFVCFTMGALSSHSRTSFRVVLERFPNHLANHWPHLPLLYFPSETKFSSFKKIESRDFPGGAVEGTSVWSLVWEDPTCHRATKPVHPEYWSEHSLKQVRHNRRSRHSEKPSTTVRSSLCSTKAPSTERGVRQRRPRAAKELIN